MAVLPQRPLGDDPSCLFQHLIALDVLALWEHNSSLCLHLLLAVYPLCPTSSSYKESSHIALGPTLIQYNLTLT